MYSPISPRRSAKNSPRKPLLSPSELTPFSFSSDNLHIFEDESLKGANASSSQPLCSGSSITAVVNESGMVPMSLPISQPMTPNSGYKFNPNHPQSAPGGRSVARSYSLNGSMIGSLGSGGSGVREVDDTIRELRKENFNLKLRIYFLEERLGSSSKLNIQAGSKDELIQANMELKVQCESLKYDVKEKSELLAEASKALDQMESKMTSMASEREDERRTLEEKLRQIDEFSENQHFAEDITADADDHLLHEVEQELRGTLLQNRSKPAERSCQTESKSSILGVVPEEKDIEHLASKVEELEATVDQLTICIGDTEACLLDAQQRAANLQNEVSKKDANIEALVKNSRSQTESAIQAQNELAELASKATDQAEESESKVKTLRKEKDELLQAFSIEKQDLMTKLTQLQQIIADKDQELKALSNELQEKTTQLEILKGLQDKGCEKTQDHAKTVSSCCSSPDGAYKIVHQSEPTLNSNSKLKSLQMVTQTLHIPPSLEVSEATMETEKLRKEVKKLREYYRLSVQGLKGTLKDRVQERENSKSMSPCGSIKSETAVESSVQCNLLETKNYWTRFAKLQQKLVSFNEVTDLLKSQLEATCDLLEPASIELSKYNRNISATLDNIVKSNTDMLKAVNKSLEDLESQESAEYNSENEFKPISPALSNECLPDPSEIEFPETPQETLLRQLQDDIENKMEAISALSERIEQKDQVINEQAEKLDEYRVEIMHLRGDAYSKLPPKPSPKKVKDQYKGELSGSDNPLLDCSTRAQSEEEETWSLPDRDASRKRMGLSQHVLTLIERTGANFGGQRGDSSETEEQCRQRLKQFYALDYTEQDFSETAGGEFKNTLDIGKSPGSSSQGGPQCQSGIFHCLLSSFQTYSRSMDELAYQLSLSDTLDWSYDEDEEDFTESHSINENVDGGSTKLQLELCNSCSKSLPIEIEDGLHRLGVLIINSTNTLKHLRMRCSKLKNKIRSCQENVSEKSLLISQLEEAIKHLGNKVDSVNEENERKSKDFQEVQRKLTDYYKFVAELKSDNLRLSTEKSAAEQLLEEVRGDQNLLRDKLNKAQRVIEESMPIKDDTWHKHRQSSPETSASSFDFFPPNSPSYKGSRRRGSIPPSNNRGRARNNPKYKWKSSSDYNSENTSVYQPRPRSNSKNSSHRNQGGSHHHAKGAGSDVSSPDLGVDLGSDPFSSLERTNNPIQQSTTRTSITAILEENKRLKHDKERLSEQLSQSKGALRETLDRLHKKDVVLTSPMPSRRLFSSAVAAAVTNQPPPLSLKEELKNINYKIKGKSKK